MKTAISVPDETFARVDRATAKLGISRSEFYSRAAEHWLRELEGRDLTAAINAALDRADQERDMEFVRTAAHRAAATGQWD